MTSLSKRGYATDQHGITHRRMRETLRGLSETSFVTTCGIIGQWEGWLSPGFTPRVVLRFEPSLETTCMACIAEETS